ncbi:MAG TPA: FAD/NAD(P)-binding protein, partial [Sphingomicrobium sp.]|nr:FAD/NAD(P)-binding protein [Sphingomicrobium sp.]
MRSDGDAADVIIVGGGYSGTMVAAELARRGVPSMLVEGSGREGRGTAYSTREDAHLLNVAAGRMGAWADKPGDFAEAVAAEGHGPHDFVPRRRYGEYLGSILRHAVDSGMAKVAQSAARSAEATEDGWKIGLADGSRIEGRALVLAQGNQAPAALPFARNIPDTLFVNDPWSNAGRQAVAHAAAEGGDVLMIGTGLTMVDLVLSLDEAAHRGRIVALSRRGLAPRAHAATHEAATIDWAEVPKGSVTGLLRWLRKATAVH